MDRAAGGESPLCQQAQHMSQLVHLALDRAADLVIWLDAEARMLYVNQAACQALEYQREELLSMTIPAINPDDGMTTTWLACWEEINAHGALTFETLFRKKSGDTIPVEVTAHHLIYQGNAYHYAFIRDITTRKQAEFELHVSEQRYRLVAEKLLDGVGIIQNMQFRFVNPALAALFDLSQEQLLGKALYQFVREDHREACQKICQELEMGTSVEKMQTIFLGQNHRETWVEVYPSQIIWQGQPAIFGIFRDISQAKQQEIAEAEEKRRLRQENITLRASMKDRYKLGAIIGKSLLMQQVYELIVKAAASDANVIIYGESGTGKELVARTIHDMSARKDEAFIPVNCGAIPENLFESEFFGHRKGAFTGAYTHKRGLFDLAHKGTLFLDEVGELGVNMQVKLLRAIETGEYTPLGSTTPLRTDLRIISATNRDLIESLAQKLFREDFLYRIHVIPIHLPPLRERKEDLPLLVEYFLEGGDHAARKAVIPEKIMEALYDHDWPGNIRELQNVLNRYVTLQQLYFMRTSCASRAVESGMVSWETFLEKKLTLPEVIAALEKEFLSKALFETHQNKTKAAEMLGLPERTFYRKMKIYNL